MILLARFEGMDTLVSAAGSLRRAGVGPVETYTPIEIPDPETSNTEVSRLPLLVLAAGVSGAIFFFLLQWYANARGYPIDIGGRPDFSWPAFVPNAFEFGVLCAVICGFVGYLASNGLPKLYAPVDRSAALHAASRDGYFLAVTPTDPLRARSLLEAQRPRDIEVIAS